MKKKILFPLLVLCFCAISTAQRDNVFAEINYNTFLHGSLKSFQEEFVEDITQVDVREDDRFPSNFGFTAGYHLGRIKTDFFLPL